MAYQARKNNSRSGDDSILSNNKATNNQTAKGSSNNTKPDGGESHKSSNLSDKVNSLKNGYNSLKNGYNSLKNGINSLPSTPLMRTTTGGIVGNNNSNNKSGGEKNNSLPSSDDNKNDDLKQKANNDSNNDSNSNDENAKKNKTIGERLKNAVSNRSKSSSKTSQNIVEELAAKARRKIIITVSIVVGVALGIMLIFFLLTSFITNVLGNFGDLLSFNFSFGGDIGDVNSDYISLDNYNLFNAINEVRNDFLSEGKDVDATLVVSVLHVISENNKSFNYDNVTKDDIRVVCNAMFVDGVFDEEAFKERLVTDVFPRFGNFTESRRKIMVDEVYKYIEDYKDFIYSGSEEVLCGNGNKCVYDIKGFYIPTKGNVSERIKIDDLYVRLMQCGKTNDGHDYGGTFGQPLADEELVPFEKYILGVARQEISESSPKEAIKAQMVAARSYILARHVDMGDWRTLKKENGKWVLQAASCTADQVYCDPDKGCSSTNGQWGIVHSGLNYNRGFVKEPLSTDSPLRTYAKEVAGEVLVNSQGYVIYTTYNNVEQNKIIQLANSGLDYKQILLQIYNQGEKNYGAANIVKNSCSNTSAGCGTISSGEYVNWKQYEGPWANDIIAGNLTIRDIGCFATSISILIAKSGVETIDGPNFNPGTFVKHMREFGGFSAGGYLQYGPIPRVAPGFQSAGAIGLSTYSREQKLNIIKQKLNEGYYLSAEVMGSTGSHFVAIDTVQGDNIIMMDPASHATNMWSQYPWYNTSKIELFTVNK